MLDRLRFQIMRIQLFSVGFANKHVTFKFLVPKCDLTQKRECEYLRPNVVDHVSNNFQLMKNVKNQHTSDTKKDTNVGLEV
jgi:hypothetical protein